MFLIFIIIGWSVSFVANTVSAQPYLSLRAPNTLCSSDSLDTRSDTAPMAAPRAKLLLARPTRPAGIVTRPVAATPLAAATVPTARDPKWTNPRNCLPHHVCVSIGLW